MSSENEQILLLKEILKWIRFAGMKQVKEVLASVLDTQQKKLAYQLSDGSRGIVEIEKEPRNSSDAPNATTHSENTVKLYSSLVKPTMSFLLNELLA